MTNQRDELVSLTRTLGEPQKQYVVVGEGNTSTRIDDKSFWIKASGHGMQNIDENGFVAVRFEPILAMLENPPQTLSEQNDIMELAKVSPDVEAKPSVEVSFHALLLSMCNVNYIGHTHPVAVNKLMCSNRAEQFATHRIFPDEAVLCGPESVFVPYADPGLPLAIAMRSKVEVYMETYGEAPKVILLASHGLIVLGQTPSEILNVTAMCVKAAEIFSGACMLGEPVFMSHEDVMHIYKRPDEIYRRRHFTDSD